MNMNYTELCRDVCGTLKNHTSAMQLRSNRCIALFPEASKYYYTREAEWGHITKEKAEENYVNLLGNVGKFIVEHDLHNKIFDRTYDQKDLDLLNNRMFFKHCYIGDTAFEMARTNI